MEGLIRENEESGVKSKHSVITLNKQQSNAKSEPLIKDSEEQGPSLGEALEGFIRLKESNGEKP